MPILAGYEILSEIGRGGAGVVHRARSQDGRAVALKVVRIPSGPAVARFLREQRLAAAFGEPDGFVPCLETGETPLGPFDPTVSDGDAFTAPVGSFPAGVSPVGALDRSGNVSEWCEDAYDERAYARFVAGDTSRPRGARGTTRGGNWGSSGRLTRGAVRDDRPRNKAGLEVGFRVVFVR